MNLDLAQLTAQLKEQLADLSEQRAEIQKELDAILLVQRASQREDSPPPEQDPAPSAPEEAPVTLETALPEEASVEETVPLEETPAGEEAAPPVEAAPQEETVPEPVAAAPQEEAVPEPVAAIPQEEAVPEPVAAIPQEEAVPEPAAAAVEEAVAVAEMPPQPESSPESTAEVEDRRNQLEETVMSLELNDEVAVLELLKMFQQPLSPGKIADELVAVHWNFQGQHPRAAVNAALQKMVDQGKVKQVNGGDYGLSLN